MLTIAIVGQKGGIAKTSTCAALGLGLHRAGKRVLYIDTDAQHNLTDLLCEEGYTYSLSDILTGKATIESAGVQTPQGTLVCASGALITAKIGTGQEGLASLQKAIETVNRKYDFILIDTPPRIGGLTDAAMYVSDYVILPVKADRFSWAALIEIAGNIDRINKKRTTPLKVLGVLPVMYNARTTANKYTLEAITEQAKTLEYPMLPPIRQSIAVVEMQYGNNLYASRSNAAADYMQLVNEVMKTAKRRK